MVGGGIGGLSATLALRRAGVEVDVAEINPEWSVYGVGIIQPGNALRALDALGLAAMPSARASRSTARASTSPTARSSPTCLPTGSPGPSTAMNGITRSACTSC